MADASWGVWEGFPGGRGQDCLRGALLELSALPVASAGTPAKCCDGGYRPKRTGLIQVLGWQGGDGFRGTRAERGPAGGSHGRIVLIDSNWPANLRVGTDL